MKNWLKIVLWFLLITGVLTLGIFIQKSLSEKEIPAPDIKIKSEGENTFITEEELQLKLETEGIVFDQQKRSEFEIEKIESFVRSISQVKEVEIYQHIDGSWEIKVELRTPIARIYNRSSEDFYLDEDGNTFSTSSIHTSRTLIFTGFIPDLSSSISVQRIINNDSLITIRKLDDIYRISRYVCNDPLFHSQIGQVHLLKNGDFILVPLVGDQKIIFGSAESDEEVEDKFKKLAIFYEEALPFEGWEHYSEINLKYKGQIVCKKK